MQTFFHRFFRLRLSPQFGLKIMFFLVLGYGIFIAVDWWQDYKDVIQRNATANPAEINCRVLGDVKNKPEYTFCTQENILAIWGGKYEAVMGSKREAITFPLTDWRGIQENINAILPDLKMFGYIEDNGYLNLYGIPSAIGMVLCLLVALIYIHQNEKKNAFVRIQLMKEREKERLFLAQELHDGPLQELQQIKFVLEAHATTSSDIITPLENRLLPIAENLRAICTDLRPPTISTFGLDQSLESLAFRTQKQYGIECHPLLEKENLRLPEFERLVMYRIAQEGVQNAVQHANPSHIWIRLQFTEYETTLEIQNDGQGFVVPSQMNHFAKLGHYGLLGMTERAHAIGGILQITSDLEAGTTIALTLPLPKKNSTKTFLV